MEKGAKTYLGDHVYAEVEGEIIRLSVNEGYGDSNVIYLESEVWKALTKYVEGLEDGARAGDERNDGG